VGQRGHLPAHALPSDSPKLSLGAGLIYAAPMVDGTVVPLRTLMGARTIEGAAETVAPARERASRLGRR
jgi:hypothetical protein